MKHVNTKTRLCFFFTTLKTYTKITGETRSITTWEKSSTFSSIPCVASWTWTTSRSFCCVSTVDPYKAGRELAQRSSTVSSIANIPWRARSTLRTIYRHVARNPCLKSVSIKFMSVSKFFIDFIYLPGKQRRSLQVMTLSQVLPSPVYPLGQGPHLMPSDVSRHVTPEKRELSTTL